MSRSADIEKTKKDESDEDLGELVACSVVTDAAAICAESNEMMSLFLRKYFEEVK